MLELFELPAVFLLRSTQALALSAPTILTGMLAAGVLHVLVGEARNRKWLGTGTVTSLCRAWLIAMSIPACGFGMLPVLNTLRRDGASASSLVVMGLTGPLMMPWTFGYTLDAVGPATFFALIAVSVVGTLLVGLTVRQLAKPSSEATTEAPAFAPVRSVLLKILIAAGQSLSSGVAICIAVGAAGVGLLAMAIPPNMIGDWLVERSAATAGILFAVPLLTYVNPEMATMQAHEIVASSTMPGLVVVFSLIGNAINAGVLLAALRALGWKTTMLGLVVLLSVGVIGSVVVDRMIYDPAFTPEDSHAFEDIGRPFHLFDHPDGSLTGFLHRWRKPMTAMTAPAAVCLLAVCFASKLLSDRLHPDGPKAIATWASSATLATFVACLGLVYIVLFVYTYYPPPGQIAADIRNELLESDAAEKRSQMAEHRRRLDRACRRINQLPISAMLRGRQLSDEENQCLAKLRAEVMKVDAALTAPSPPDRDLVFRYSFELARRLHQ